jgi:hypothetical protein
MRAVELKKTLLSVAAAVGLMPVLSQAVTPVFFDGFEVTANTSDMNADLGAPRQGGPLAPVPYVVNSFPAVSYHHQMFDVGSSPTTPLQLAGDSNVLGFPTATPVLVSPNYNFTGMSGAQILGKRITFDLDVGALINPQPGTGNYFTWAGFSLGGNAANVQLESSAKHFGIRFIEENAFNLGNFIQFMDGDEPSPFVVQNLLPNPAGAGPMSVQIDIDDLADGNPWDGVGSTTISVLVNGTPVGVPYTKGGGGFTNNYLTMEGSANTFGFQLATHLFNNLTVYSAPVPEPASWTLLAIGAGVLAVRARKRS